MMADALRKRSTGVLSYDLPAVPPDTDLGFGASLNIQERAALTKAERVIAKGLETFLEVGEALTVVRDGKLYRQTHLTFADYLRDRWGIGDRQGRYLMAGAEITRQITDALPGTIVPASESQVRPLARLPKEDRPKAWQKAVEESPGKQPTAKQVEAKADEIKPRASKPSSETLSETSAQKRWEQAKATNARQAEHVSALGDTELPASEPDESGESWDKDFGNRLGAALAAVIALWDTAKVYPGHREVRIGMMEAIETAEQNLKATSGILGTQAGWDILEKKNNGKSHRKKAATSAASDRSEQGFLVMRHYRGCTTFLTERHGWGKRGTAKVFSDRSDAIAQARRHGDKVVPA